MGDRLRGRFATPADFALQDCSPYSHVHVHSESLGFVHRSGTVLCRPVPNLRGTTRNFCIAVPHLTPHQPPHPASSPPPPPLCIESDTASRLTAEPPSPPVLRSAGPSGMVQAHDKFVTTLDANAAELILTGSIDKLLKRCELAGLPSAPPPALSLTAPCSLISTLPHAGLLSPHQGCWEAFCGVGRGLPLPVSDRPKSPNFLRPKQDLLPAKAVLLPSQAGSTAA